jgi:hypothetical protein
MSHVNVRRARSTILPPPIPTVAIPLRRLKRPLGWRVTASDVALYALGLALWVFALAVVAMTLAGFAGGAQ